MNRNSVALPDALEITEENVRIERMNIDEKNQVRVECTFGRWANDDGREPRRWAADSGAMIFYATPNQMRGLVPGDVIDFKVKRRAGADS